MTNVMAEAPAPGSPETTSVLAVGARGDWAPSPAARQGVQGGKSFFCDVHKTKKNGEGYRITFTTDGVTFRHVDSFLDIPAVAGDKVFVDTIPLQHTDGVIELLRRGVEVYYLRRTTLVARKREELRLVSKTARNDIKALMSIDGRWFRRVTEDFLVMRRMIACYRSLHKSHQQLLNKSKALSERERNMLKPAIKAIEKKMETFAKQIAEEAGKRYPAYSRLVNELGIDENHSAKEALAELLTYLDSKGFRKAANYVGLFRPTKGKRKIYNGRLRQTLQRLTTATNSIPSLHLTAKLEKQTLFKVWKTYKEETRGRLAIPAQQG